MNNKRIDNIFLGDDLNLKCEYISNLACEHIINKLSKRDPINNKIISDLNTNYVEKFIDLIKDFKYPLGFINDLSFSTYLFTKPHIKNIINNPHQSIIKEKELIKKYKIKVIDSNSFKWLATKPGKNFKEKLANQEKILSTVKRYSYNIKENQVLVSYFKKIKNYFNDKKQLISLYPDIFGPIEDYKEDFKNIQRNLNKINNFIKTDFEEVIAKEYSTPNNALIGNVDYASIWKSNQVIKKDTINEFDYEKFKEIMFKLIILSFMSSNKYSFMEDECNLFEDNEFIIYNYDNDDLIEYTFKLDNKIHILKKKYHKSNGQYKLKDSISYGIEINFTDKLNSKRGLPFDVIINNKSKQLYIDLIGLKDCLLFINKELDLDFTFDYCKKQEIKQIFKWASISSYDNKILSSESGYIPHCYKKNETYFEVESKNLYYSNSNNIYLNSIDKTIDYSKLLRTANVQNNFDANTVLIYDVKDCYDSFSTKSLRSAFNNSFYKTYPVWRSILAAESYNDEIDYVIDLVGNESDIVNLERTNNLFLHKGLLEWPLYIDDYNENQILSDYCSFFSKKYNVNLPLETIDDLISSGKLVEVIKNNENKTLLYGDYHNHNYYSIFYDEDIFYQCLNKFNIMINELNKAIPGKKILFVIPDYLRLFNENINYITNNKLANGVKIIEQRVLNNQICWYEMLPNLSLEIIKNGYYDELNLIKDRQCENIIGKENIFNIDETFILKAGKKNYTLPLIKSFIGEHNKMINAKLEDSSFPLSNDVEVSLNLTYSYESENSYELIFKPVNLLNKPFKQIEVIWEEDESIDNLKELPKIINTDYKPDRADRIYKYEIVYKINQILNKFKYIRDNEIYKNASSMTNQIKNLTNDIQRLMAYDTENKYNLKHYLENSHYADLLIKLIKKCQEVEDSKANPIKVEMRVSYQLEQALVAVTLDKNLFLNNNLSFPFACYGRYLGFYPKDNDILNLAYNSLLLYTKKNIKRNDHLRYYLNRMTSATASNYLFIKEACEINEIYIYKLLDVIISVMKFLSETPLEFTSNNKKAMSIEFCYEFRHCVEILISYLYVRERLMFKELRPGGKKALEIIHYIKKFNKNYQFALQDWPRDLKKPRMFTKYQMKSKSKPEELCKVWNDGYCLILYLSGAVEANNIIMNTGEIEDD